MLRKLKLSLLGLTVSVLAFAQSAPQGISVRTNLLWDGAAEPNLGLEVPVGKRLSLGLDAGFKSWPRWLFWDTDNSGNPSHWRNFAIVPEVRFYPGRVYQGLFLGADLVYTYFNVGKVSFPLGLYPETRDKRLQGDFVGLGLFGGYSWWLGDHWRLELEAGVAAGYAGYGSYRCEHCGDKLADESKPALVPKLGVNVAWNPVKRPRECDVPIPLREVPEEMSMPDPVEDPGPFRPQLAPVEPHRGAVDSVKTPFLLHIGDFQPYTPDQVLRKKRGMIKVYYPQGSSALRTSFEESGRLRDNQPALDSIVNITRMILSDDISKVEKIQIVGFSSIDGGEEANERLALARARALQEYVQKRTQAPLQAFVVENGQEGWAEFKDMLEDLLRETRRGVATGFTTGELETAVGIAGAPTLDAAHNRRKELELKKHSALWGKIKEKVLGDQRNSGYVRVYVSWVPDKAADEINGAIGRINAGQVEEGRRALSAMDDARARDVLKELEARRGAYEEAVSRYRAYEAGLVSRQEAAAARREALEWNAMAGAHNAAVLECENGKKD